MGIGVQAHETHFLLFRSGVLDQLRLYDSFSDENQPARPCFRITPPFTFSRESKNLAKSSTSCLRWGGSSLTISSIVVMLLAVGNVLVSPYMSVSSWAYGAARPLLPHTAR